MSKFKIDIHDATEQADHKPEPGSEEPTQETEEAQGDDFTAKVVTIGVVAVGVAVVESALLPGVILGAAAALAPKYFPKLGQRLQPLFNSTVRGAYKLGRKARSAVGEIQERVSDIAAEVKAEEKVLAAEPGVPEPPVQPAKVV
ncbi:MAG TPA: DUF5132 domain-containing protein [Methylocella sp.]|nr:DUF5132 domain-containing protein [Methylocella sp.]